MNDRVRPQRLGNNQNYVQRNKPRAFWMSAPLSHQNQKDNSESSGGVISTGSWDDSGNWLDTEAWKDGA